MGRRSEDEYCKRGGGVQVQLNGPSTKRQAVERIDPQGIVATSRETNFMGCLSDWGLFFVCLACRSV